MLPHESFRFSLGTSESSLSVLFSVLELTDIFATIGTGKHPVSFLLVIFVLPIVSFPVSVGENSFTVHLVILPGPDVHLAFDPFVRSLPADVTIGYLSDVSWSIGPSEAAVTMFFPVNPVTFELGTVWPGLFSLPVLFVYIPVAFILRSICTCVDPVPVSLIVDPLTFIHIASSTDESAISASLVIFKVPFVVWTVRPLACTESVPHSFVVPLSFIFFTIVKGNFGLLSSSSTALLIVFLERRKILAGLYCAQLGNFWILGCCCLAVGITSTGVWGYHHVLPCWTWGLFLVFFVWNACSKLWLDTSFKWLRVRSLLRVGEDWPPVYLVCCFQGRQDSVPLSCEDTRYLLVCLCKSVLQLLVVLEISVKFCFGVVTSMWEQSFS